MRIVHSFINHSGKLTFNYFCNIVCFTLSCLLVKHKLDYKMILYADSKTVEFMSKIGTPYDEFHIIESINYPHSNIYAYPKFLAMVNEPLGSIHIDGDVFLFGDNFEKILNFKDYDLICQCIETLDNFDAKYAWDLASDELKRFNYPEWARKNIIEMFNCGVIGINNPQLKDEYFKLYWNCLEQYKYCAINRNGTPDIIFEQSFLLDMCKHKKYKFKTVLDNKNLSKSAKSLEYTHILGNIKYTRPTIKWVLSKIKEIDIQIWKNLKNFSKLCNI